MAKANIHSSYSESVASETIVSVASICFSYVLQSQFVITIGYNDLS